LSGNSQKRTRPAAATTMPRRTFRRSPRIFTDHTSWIDRRLDTT
jgi:hypothetical protein